MNIKKYAERLQVIIDSKMVQLRQVAREIKELECATRKIDPFEQVEELVLKRDALNMAYKRLAKIVKDLQPVAALIKAQNPHLDWLFEEEKRSDKKIQLSVIPQANELSMQEKETFTLKHELNSFDED